MVHNQGSCTLVVHTAVCLEGVQQLLVGRLGSPGSLAAAALQQHRHARMVTLAACAGL